MKREFLAAVFLIVGCGHDTLKYQPGRDLCPTHTCDPPVGNFNVYVIDAGASIPPYPGTYGITTNGMGDWLLSWQGDAQPHSLSGDIYCQVGHDFNRAAVVFLNPLPSDHVDLIANNHIHFEATSEMGSMKQLQFSTAASDEAAEPIDFDLQIDTRPAINPYVVFSSSRQLATSEIMPFSLVSSTNVF